MSKVWRRLQRVGKKAYKYRFFSQSHSLKLNCTNKWKAQKVCLVWSHRGRKHSSKLANWEPTLGNIYDGVVEFDANDMIEFEVTLYKSINDDKYEEKEWVLMIESEDSKGKRNLLASTKMNVENFVSIEPFTQQEFKDLEMKSVSSKVKSASLSFTLAAQFLKEGKATDEDMISIASFMSTASSATASNNPYLNSNRFNTKYSSDSEADESGPKHDTTNISKNIFQMNDDDDDDDFNNYFKFDGLTPSKAAKSAFNNNIEHHFKQPVLETPATIRSDPNDSTVVAPVIKSSSLISSSLDSTPVISSSTTRKKTTAASKLAIASSNKENQESSKQHLPSLQKVKVAAETLPSSSASARNPFDDEAAKTPKPSKPASNNPFGDDDDSPKVKSTSKATKKEMLSSGVSSSLDGGSNTSRELLVWCQSIISKVNSMPVFANLNITDFSSSWSNGLAFCAIIYHFRPNLINISHLSTKDTKRNLKEAFSASDSEKIMRVVDYPDIINRKQIDPLSIMTYLYQMRDIFESSSANQKSSQSNEKQSNSPQQQPQQKTMSKKEIENMEKSIKKLSVNPFEDESETANTKPIKNGDDLNPFSEKPSPKSVVDKSVASQSSNPSDELIRKAKLLIEKTRLEDASSGTTNEDLKKRAKEMMSAAQSSGSVHRRKSSTKKHAPSEIKAAAENGTAAQTEGKKQAPTAPLTVNQSMANNKEEDLLGTEYINAELAKLRELQKELDDKGDTLERELRGIMRKQPENSEDDKDIQSMDRELEDALLREWFLLVNKKNALLHRQQELEILQNEKSLEKRYEILSNQLRNLMSMDEDLKTAEQRRIEAILFSELISLVNKRNELVIQLDEENKLLNAGEMINEFIQNKTTFAPKEKQCSIQ